MMVLVEEGVSQICINPIREVLSGFGIIPSFRSCKINGQTSMKNISEWVERKVKDKVVILTKSGLKSTRWDTAINYSGISNEIGGNLALIHSENLSILPYVCLHEVFHLEGIRHCHEAGCLMSLKLCDGEAKYCLLCKMRCNTLHLCSRCESLWKKRNT